MFKKILSILLLVVWLIFIFTSSSNDGEKSQSKSDTLIIKTVELFTNIEEGSDKMNHIINIASFPVRKCAHFFEYFLLAILVMNVLYIFKINYKIIIASIFCILIASSDEVHQLFVSGRSGQISDVLLDLSASLICIFFYFNYVKGKFKHE